MISEQNKNLAQWAMEYALKSGCQAAKLVLYSDSNASFELRDGKIDRLQQATENGLSLSLYVDGRFGSFSTNRLDRGELKSLIDNGIESTRYLAKDESRMLADPSRYYKGGRPDLCLFDNRLADINPDEKVELARRAADEVMGKDERIISVETSYSDGESAEYRLISNGFEGEKQSSWCSLSASVSIKGEGEARPQDYWYDSALFYDKLLKSGIGTQALERVLRKLGQKKVASGKYTLVVDPMNAGNLLRPMMNALMGSSLQQKNSFLLDKLGSKVASDLCNLRDEPHVVGGKGSSYFDNEGVATQPRDIFEQGVLRTYFIDTYNAKKMNVEPTISAPSRVVLKPGSKDLNGLVTDVERGILVTGFNGGNSNSSTGDFSYGIEGFLIENGRLTQPVNEMNVTGNFLELWSGLVAVGNDPQDRSWLIPSLVFEGVNFSGL
ncbi:MAG: TldD/PmbA family protein [Bacteroides sp.]